MCIDQYVQIVEDMLKRNEKITLEAVRRTAGKGSFSTISEAIKLVLNRGLIPTDVTGPMPESLVDVAKDIWIEACKQASALVASERAALHSARMESRETQLELMTLADSQAQRLDELTSQVETLTAEKSNAEKRAQELEISLKETRKIMKELGLKARGKEEGEPAIF